MPKTLDRRLPFSDSLHKTRQQMANCMIVIDMLIDFRQSIDRFGLPAKVMVADTIRELQALHQVLQRESGSNGLSSHQPSCL